MHTFMIAWPSADDSFSFFQTASRKRLTRPSSRPSASPLRVRVSASTSYAPSTRFGSRYFASSFSVFGQS